ncbi:MAG: carbonate dehydratase [Gammaproteobacteria bacterium]|jgi:carbonic anhydrase|nr:carbonate dehydratase [Gammaproteobacteria bacterium]
MKNSFQEILQGYQLFREKYASGDNSVMQYLSDYGQQPQIMVVSCCDSRVDPALILQCNPGDLFVLRNVANIIPPYEKDEAHHGTSAALEFGINFLKIQHLVLLGHSQCAGIQALLNKDNFTQNDFITQWVSVIKTHIEDKCHADEYAKLALSQSLQNCLTFPWIKSKITRYELNIHRWFFDVKKGQIFTFSDAQSEYIPL